MVGDTSDHRDPLAIAAAKTVTWGIEGRLGGEVVPGGDPGVDASLLAAQRAVQPVESQRGVEGLTLVERLMRLRWRGASSLALKSSHAGFCWNSIG
jgi:hypothetical protein